MFRAAVTTSPWLGERKNDYTQESFPETTLNDRQIRALFSTRNGARMVQDLSHTARPAIMALTDEITEIHVEFGGHWPNTRHVIFWYDKSGNSMATVEEKYEGPQGIHPPGAKFRKWAVAYLRRPEMSSFAKAEEIEYEHLFGLGRDGAIDKTRQFIHDTWVNTDDKE